MTTDAYGFPTMDLIKKDGPPDKPWTLYNEEGTKVLGRHATKPGAMRQEQLIKGKTQKDTLHNEEEEKKKSAHDNLHLTAEQKKRKQVEEDALHSGEQKKRRF